MLDGRQYHGLTLWAPNINLFRDARWGRGQETPGEDPYLTSAYANQFVRGIQGDEENSGGYLLASAALKHFAAYSSEGPGSDRDRFRSVAEVGAQDMADSFLPAFRDGIELGNASGLMCAYDAITYGEGSLGRAGTAVQPEAIPSCANKYLITDLARGEWGFQGVSVLGSEPDTPFAAAC